MEDHARLRELLSEYRILRELNGHTPQSRGQRFNGFLAEVLRCWGISATENLMGSGEVDVAFSIGGTRFILEAKWEGVKTDTGQISKLQKRVRQRLGGTIGVFLSMAGFSDRAIAELKEGERLEVLLLDRVHFEGMLSGVVPPDELFTTLVDRASFLGEPYVSLWQLISSVAALEEIRFGLPSEIGELVRYAAGDLRAEAALSNLPFGQHGVAELEPARILVTLVHGVVEADLAARTTRLRIPIPGCSRNPLPREGGEIYFVRKYGVALFGNEGISIVAGAFPGPVSLTPGADSDVWAFSNSSSSTDRSGSGGLLVRLGPKVGDEVPVEIPYQQWGGMNAAWLEGDRFLVTGSAGIKMLDLGGEVVDIPSSISNPMGLARLDESSFLIAGGDVEIARLDVRSGTITKLAELNLHGSIAELAPGTDQFLLFSHYTGTSATSVGIVVRLFL